MPLRKNRSENKLSVLDKTAFFIEQECRRKEQQFQNLLIKRID
jgi:hypothetical protein